MLSALSFGLVAFSINLVLIRGFNAFEDTRTQVISIFVINVISVGLSYLFLATFKSRYVTIGLGGAFSVSYLVGLFVTLSLLKKHIGKLSITSFLSQHFKLLVAAFLAIFPLWLVSHFLKWSTTETALGIRAGRLLFILCISGGGYLLIARAMKIAEVSALGTFVQGLVKRGKEQ